MQLSFHKTNEEMGRCAAAAAARAIHDAIQSRGRANIVLATGTSQFEVLASLTAVDGIDWSRVTAFHLDEYLGLPMSHPASFRGYLRQRFVECLPTPLAAMHYINGEASVPQYECARLARPSRRARSM